MYEVIVGNSHQNLERPTDTQTHTQMNAHTSADTHNMWYTCHSQTVRFYAYQAAF